jgi:putative nucleotidyltransferase with HDIG domain
VSEPVRFLNSFAQVLATMGLYAPGHPARTRGVDAAYAELGALQQVNVRPHFSFLDGNVVYGQRALNSLRSWPWSARLADAGVQRMEFPAGVSRADFELFLNEILRLLSLPGVDASARAGERSSIRYGSLSLRGEADAADTESRPERPAVSLGEEVEVARWLYRTVEESEELPLQEAEALVRSLTVALHGDGGLLLPLIRLKAHDEYAVMHSINVSVLTMCLAESLGLGARDVHAFGVAGLLHDIGMARVNRDLVVKDSLSLAEQALVERHPMEGARILLRSEAPLDIAVTAAYEHHMQPDGRGYPAVRFRRGLHYATRLVQVCSVYDALRTARPFRPAWTGAQALDFIADGAGTQFDAAVAQAFIAMIRRLDGAVVGVEVGVA